MGRHKGTPILKELSKTGLLGMPNHIKPMPYDFLVDESKTTKGVKENEGKTIYEFDWSFLKLMANRMSSNKNKYPPYNWKKPMDIEELKQATFRHLIEVMEGNYDDNGSEFGHLEAISLNAMMIYYQLKQK